MKVDERPPIATRGRTVSIAAVVTALVLIAVIATLASGRLLLGGGSASARVTPTVGSATATATATATAAVTATPNLTPLAPTGQGVILGRAGAPRQVNPVAASAAPFAVLTLAQRQLLNQQRDWRAGLTQNGQPTNLGVPHVSSTPIGGRDSPGVIHDLSRLSFQGQDSATLAALTPTGATVAPSVSLCVGMSAEMELTSAAATFYDRSGHLLSRLVSLDSFFGEPVTFTSPQGDTIVSWPTQARCTYDVPSRSWFAVATVIGLDLNTSQLYGRTHLDVATNQREDPRTAWTVYELDTTNDGANKTPHEQGCPCISDHPLLGDDDSALYVSTNEFALIGGFLGARIYMLDKYELLHRSQQVHMAQFTHLALGGSLVASVQPSLFFNSVGAEFFMAALDPSGTFDNRLGVWALTNENALGAGGQPRLASTIVLSETYGMPPSAGVGQPGSSVTLRAGDDTMQDVEYVGGVLYSTMETAAWPSGDSAARTGAAWFNVQAQVGSGGSVHASMLQQGYIATANTYLVAPALGVAGDIDQVLSATALGDGLYPSVVYTTTHPLYNSPFGHLAVIAQGGQSGYASGCAPTSWGGSCPWFAAGSTAWDATDPAGEAWMWMAAGYAPQGSADYGTSVYTVGPI